MGRAQERFLRDKKKKKRQAMYLKIEELKFLKIKTLERHIVKKMKRQATA